MTLDELLIGIGIKADTSGADKAKKSLDGVKGSAADAERSTKGFGAKFSSILRSAGAIAAAAFSVIKGALIGAMGFLTSTISKYEELYNTKDKDLKITKEQYLAAKKYTEGVDKAKKSIEGIKNKIAFAFLPTMLQMINSFNKFIDSNKQLITTGITGLLSALSYVSNAITNTIRFIDRLVTSTIGWKGALIALAVALAFVKRAMIMAFITNPVAWVVAAIVGLILLIDDFMTYLDGGESEFGEFWGAMIEWIEKVKPHIEAIGKWLVDTFNAVYPVVLAVFEYLSDQVSNIIDIFSAFFDFLSAMWGGNTEDAIAALEKLGAGIVKLVARFIQAFISIAPKILQIMAVIAGYIIDGLIGAFGVAIDLVAAFVEGVANSIRVLFTILTQPFVDAFNYVDGLLGSALSNIGAFLSAMLSMFVSVLGRVFSAISSLVSNGIGAFSRFVSSIGSVFSGVFSLITAPFGKAFDWILNKFGQLPSLLKNIVSTATFGLSDKIGGVVSGIVSNTTKSTTVNGGAVNATFNVSSSNPVAAAKQTSNLLQSTNSMALRNAMSGIKL